jgi:DNA modification methylase
MKPYLADPDVTLYVGDAAEVLACLPADSIDCVVTSPPYWALRDYGVEGQIGLEPTPQEFVERLVGVFAGVRRVLAPHGTLWLSIGDSYNSTRNHGVGENSGLTNPERQRRLAADVGRHKPSLKPKDLVGIPWRLALAMQDDGWFLRAEVIWEKANPMPESVEDRPARSHEQVFLFSKSARYFYDHVAVREPVSGTANSRGSGMNPKAMVHADASSGVKQNASAAAAFADLTSRRNLRSVWRVASRPFPGAHFAVFPPDLVEPCILAGTSAAGGCSACGKPWLPINERRSLSRHELPTSHPEYRPTRYEGKHEETNGGGQRYLDIVTVGWEPSCACDAPARPAVVLDPFMGSGTTALVARKLGRHAVGIELKPEYAALSAERLQQLSLLAGETCA